MGSRSFQTPPPNANRTHVLSPQTFPHRRRVARNELLQRRAWRTPTLRRRRRVWREGRAWRTCACCSRSCCLPRSPSSSMLSDRRSPALTCSQPWSACRSRAVRAPHAHLRRRAACPGLGNYTCTSAVRVPASGVPCVPRTVSCTTGALAADAPACDHDLPGGRPAEPALHAGQPAQAAARPAPARARRGARVHHARGRHAQPVETSG